MADEVRVTGTSLNSFAEAADSAFEKIESDGPEGAALARVDQLRLSRGGVVGSTQYHVEIVQIPWEQRGP